MNTKYLDQVINDALIQAGLRSKPGVISRISAKVEGRVTMNLAPNNTYLFDTVNTDNTEAKAALNLTLNKLPYIYVEGWEKIIDTLNENAVDNNAKVTSKEGYRIALIKFIKSFSEELVIDFAMNNDKQYVYTSQYWAELEDDLLRTFLRNAALRLGIPEGLSRDEVWLKKALKQYTSEGFYEIEKSEGITYINLNNGILKISDKDGAKLVKHDPKLFQTSLLDYDYNPKSVNKGWLDFIEEVIPDENTRKTLQQSLGYLFIRDLKLEKMFILFGNGANGKSVIFEVLKGLLDENLITHNSLKDLCNKNSSSTQYYEYQLNGKLINYASDISLKDIDPAGFKTLVSGEPKTVRQLAGKTFLMKDYAKLIFNANRLDDASIENTKGFFRRIIIIPFEVTIPPEKRDKKLHEKLLTNKSGILNWILKGIEEVRKNHEIFESDKVKEKLEQFQVDASPVRTFLDENNYVKADLVSTDKISLQNLFDQYKKFCQDQKEPNIPRRIFSAEMKRLGFEVVRPQGVVHFRIKVAKKSSTTSSHSPEVADLISRLK